MVQEGHGCRSVPGQVVEDVDGMSGRPPVRLQGLPVVVGTFLAVGTQVGEAIPVDEGRVLGMVGGRVARVIEIPLE